MYVRMYVLYPSFVFEIELFFWGQLCQLFHEKLICLIDTDQNSVPSHCLIQYYVHTYVCTYLYVRISYYILLYVYLQGESLLLNDVVNNFVPHANIVLGYPFFVGGFHSPPEKEK